MGLDVSSVTPGDVGLGTVARLPRTLTARASRAAGEPARSRMTDEECLLLAADASTATSVWRRVMHSFPCVCVRARKIKS